MINILHYPSDTKNGVWYYRSKTPYISLAKSSDEFKINITNRFSWDDAQAIDYIAKNCNIFTVHNGIYVADQQDKFWEALIYLKKNGVKTVLDIDDYWNYGEDHPMHVFNLANAIPQKMLINFNFFDMVTTTTEYFASKIRKHTEAQVEVLPNAISKSDSQFSIAKKKSSKIRLGLTGGASHINDIKQLLNFPDFMSKDALSKIELVFCGYDLAGEKQLFDENGNVTKVPMKPEENWWHLTEQHWIRKLGEEHYMRVPTTSIDKGEYGHVYEDIDVLLVPLKSNEFNSCKSELKFIEAGFTNTAVIASNTSPYRDYGHDKEDCLLVKEAAPRAWAYKIQKIVNDNEMRRELASSLRKRVISERTLEDVTKKRIEIFKRLACNIS